MDAQAEPTPAPTPAPPGAVHSEASFQAMPFPVRAFGGLGNARYRIYVAPRQFKEVEAETAAEAIQKAGAPEVARIQRYIKGREVLVAYTALHA